MIQERLLTYLTRKQIKLLQNVKQSVAEVTTSKKMIELQKAALQANREDLARKAVENKAALQSQSAILYQQIADLNDQQQKLMAAESRLATKVEAFRTKRLQKPRSRSPSS